MIRFIDHVYGKTFNPPSKDWLSLMGCLVELRFPGANVKVIYCNDTGTQYHNMIRFICPGDHPTVPELYGALFGFDPDTERYPDFIHERHLDLFNAWAVTAPHPDTAQTSPSEPQTRPQPDPPEPQP